MVKLRGQQSGRPLRHCFPGQRGLADQPRAGVRQRGGGTGLLGLARPGSRDYNFQAEVIIENVIVRDEVISNSITSECRPRGRQPIFLLSLATLGQGTRDILGSPAETRGPS